MSRLITFTSEGEEAVTTATETIVQARGVTTLVPELAEVSGSCDQEATTEIEVALWEVLYQTTDGTATGATEVPGHPGDPTPALTGFHSFTAEPNAGSIIPTGHAPQPGGEFYRYWADGDGPQLDDATTSRIGLRVTATLAGNVVGAMRWRIVAA
jgi:hypothetical protein